MFFDVVHRTDLYNEENCHPLVVCVVQCVTIMLSFSTGPFVVGRDVEGAVHPTVTV